MIIIELTYELDNPRGGRRIYCVKRKAFADSDVDGVNKFLNTDPEENGEWYNRDYNITKY